MLFQQGKSVAWTFEQENDFYAHNVAVTGKKQTRKLIPEICRLVPEKQNGRESKKLSGKKQDEGAGKNIDS